MSDEAAIVYLEADDEVTSVVRRVRQADGDAVIVVAPGRSRAVSSVVALRLLARAAERSGRRLLIVGDALTRSLAGEAGLGAHATLDDARRAEIGAPPLEPTRAAISVVRGPAADETAPTMTAAPLTVTADEVTRTVSVPRAASRARHPVHARRRRRLPAGIVAAAGALLLAAVVAVIAVLPGAVVTIVPRTEAVGPATYEIVASDVEELSGTVDAQAEVRATGTYEDLEPAAGSVVLLNWSNVPVSVEAGTFVAAGAQAFATQSAVVVPRGSLTGAGTIAAGEVTVAVVAAAPGPDANVAPAAIDTVLDASIDGQLRGFPENPERTVTNPEATTGGLSASGPEMTQEDVDAALATLRDELAEMAAAELPEDGIVVADPSPPAPTITGLEDLVGRRDATSAAITGELAWSVRVVDEQAIREEALERFTADDDVLSNGLQVLPDTVDVRVGSPAVSGATVRVEATVAARAAVPIDVDAIREAVAGATPEDLRADLAPMGAVTIDLWPPWVATVPSLGWRIDVRVESPEEANPTPSTSPSP